MCMFYFRMANTNEFIEIFPCNVITSPNPLLEHVVGELEIGNEKDAIQALRIANDLAKKIMEYRVKQKTLEYIPISP